MPERGKTGRRRLGSDLSRADRRRVQRLVGHGEAAWDVPSARYALGVIAAREQSTMLFGRRATAVLFTALTIFQIDDVYDAVRAHRWSAVIYPAFASVLFATLVVAVLRWSGPLDEAREANNAVLDRHGAPRTSASIWPDPAGFERRQLAAVVVIGGLFGLSLWVGDGRGSPWGPLIGGVVFGVAMTWAIRGFLTYAREADVARVDAYEGTSTLRAQGGLAAGQRVAAGSSPPLAYRAYLRLPARGRRAARAAGTAFGGFFAWIFLVSEVQLPTCEAASGGIPSGDQVGFTRAFCGTPSAAVADVVLAYVLIGVIPIVGLVLGTWAAGWQTGRRRRIFLGTAATCLVVPVVLAWLLAGAHT